MNSEHYLFVGVHKSVLAIDQRSGEIKWETKLPGTGLGDSFVNVFFDGGCVFAHGKGVLCCLNPESGEIKWQNPLTGYGFGIATMVSVNSSSGNLAAILRRKEEEQQAAAAGAAGAGAGA